MKPAERKKTRQHTSTSLGVISRDNPIEQRSSLLASCIAHDAPQYASLHLSPASCLETQGPFSPEAASLLPRRSNKQQSTQLASCTVHDASRYASQLADQRHPSPQSPPSPAQGVGSGPRQTNPASSHATDKGPIFRQESRPRPPLKCRQRSSRPLFLCECGPLFRHPIPYYPMVPCCQG